MRRIQMANKGIEDKKEIKVRIEVSADYFITYADDSVLPCGNREKEMEVSLKELQKMGCIFNGVPILIKLSGSLNEDDYNGEIYVTKQGVGLIDTCDITYENGRKESNIKMGLYQLSKFIYEAWGK
jgi:hypothetical protein